MGYSKSLKNNDLVQLSTFYNDLYINKFKDIKLE